jgi:hypothetical protein
MMLILSIQVAHERPGIEQQPSPGHSLLIFGWKDCVARKYCRTNLWPARAEKGVRRYPDVVQSDPAQRPPGSSPASEHDFSKARSVAVPF